MTWECIWFFEDRFKFIDFGVKWEGRVREESDIEVGEGVDYREFFGFYVEGNGKALGGGDGFLFVKLFS